MNDCSLVHVVFVNFILQISFYLWIKLLCTKKRRFTKVWFTYFFMINLYFVCIYQFYQFEVFSISLNKVNFTNDYPNLKKKHKNFMFIFYCECICEHCIGMAIYLVEYRKSSLIRNPWNPSLLWETGIILYIKKVFDNPSALAFVTF